MKYIFHFIIIVLLSSCGGKTEAVVNHTSPNGKVNITVTGKRSNTIEAFRTEIAVKAYELSEGKLIFEIYADDLSGENVKFAWTDDTHCTINIEQRDGATRNFALLATESSVQLAEIRQ